MIFNSGRAQFLLFSRDSLRFHPRTEILKSLPASFLKGIVAANYSKKSWIEDFPLTAVELPSRYLTTPSVHPRLLTNFQLERVRQRLGRYPFLDWYQSMKEQVETGLFRTRLADGRLVAGVSEFIKNLAFLYRVEGDPRYLKKATELLAELPEPPEILNFEGGRNGQGWGDFLQSSQALLDTWVALDLLYNDLPPDLRHQVRRKLLIITRQVTEALLYTPANNHVVVMSIAILTAALTEEHPENFIAYTRQELWQIGLNYLSRALGLIAPDGGYAEGVYYGNFVTNNLAPFSVYLENTTGIQLFKHPYLERMVNWLLANEKGSGNYSAFDDAFQVRFFYLPVIIPQSRLKSNWYAQWRARQPPSRANENLVEALCVFEPLPEDPVVTETPVQFFPESGQVIFRDRPIRPRIFASFISENERWFASRHEHIDPLNFELSAFGEDFIVDGGYGSGTGDENRYWYTSGFANNGILIDGRDTYRNPIWGDPNSSTLLHTFRTPASAAATITHTRGDVDLHRKVYFLRHRFILMIDRIEGNRSHDVSLNFNYLGDLQQETDVRLRIQGQTASLSIFTITSQEAPPHISRDFSLYTPPGKPAPAGSFRIELPQIRSGYFVTLLYPRLSTEFPRELVEYPLSGIGELIRIPGLDDGDGEIEFAVNRGRLLKSDRWQSDARVIAIGYDPALQIRELILVSFTRFHSDQVSLQSDVPITLFLEDSGINWQGYVETPDEKLSYHLTVSGIQAFPFRMNRIPLTPEIDTGGQQRYKLTGSGTLDIGTGLSPVIVPYAYHRPPGLLEWLSQQSHPRQQYEYWSDYQKQVFRNQLMGNILSGMGAGIRDGEQRYFNGLPILSTVGYTLFGVSENSYTRNSSSTFDIRIPHRYELERRIGNWNGTFFEEGVFSPNSLKMQNVQFFLRQAGGREFAYRGTTRFREHQSHQVQFFTAGGSGGMYRIASFRNQVEQQVQIHVQHKGIRVNPGYRWRHHRGNREAFLDWQLNRFRGRLRRMESGDTLRWYQQLSGFGSNWAFTLEGQQQLETNSQRYRFNLFYQTGSTVIISQGGQVEKRTRWQLPLAFSELRWRGNGMTVRGRLAKESDKTRQQVSVNWARKGYRVHTSTDFENFAFGKTNRLQTRWSYRTRSGFSAYSNFIYRYQQPEKKYAGDLLHTLAVPLGSRFTWQPIVGVRFPATRPLQWLGSGFSFYGRYALYGQVVYRRWLNSAIVEYQLALDFNAAPQIDKAGFTLWLNVQQQGNRIYRTEVRIQPPGDLRQPGLYYSYLRGAGSRLEGYLQWRW